MSTTIYIPVRVDTRGSVNLPADIKSRLGINLGSSVLVRQIGNVVILIPFHGEAEQAASEDRLHAWVGQQLNTQVSEAPVQVTSKMATAEAIRLQASRERFEQRKAILELQKEIAQLKGVRPKASEKYRGVVVSDPIEDPIASLRAARQTEADQRLNNTLQQASEDMAGETPTLPQA